MKALFKKSGSNDPATYQTLLMVDFSNLRYKVAYNKGYANLRTKKGIYTGHVFGMAKMLLGLYSHFDRGNTALVLVYDDQPLYKLKIFPEYKAARRSKPKEEILEQTEFGQTRSDINLLLERIPHFSVKAKTHEADDALASFINKYKSPKTNFVIYSSDQDLWQLISKRTSCYAKELVTNEDFQKHYRMPMGHAKKIVLYKSLYGDSSDGIPGVNSLKSKEKKLRWEPALGELLLACDGTYKDFYQKLLTSDLKSKPRIIKAKKLVKRNYKLIKLLRNLKFEQSYIKGDFEGLRQFLNYFECKSLQSKIGVFF